MTKRPAVFLDRDGVINENRDDYVKSWGELRFLPGIFGALQRLRHSNYRVVLVTNQSAVGRGLITHQAAAEINRRVVAEIKAQGGRIDATYFCPHHPDAACACRKPAPGMLLQAARELGLNLAQSYLIGDAVSDLAAASAVEAQGIMVLTGRGRTELTRIAALGASRWPVAADLAGALAYIPSIPKASGVPEALPTNYDTIAGEAR